MKIDLSQTLLKRQFWAMTGVFLSRVSGLIRTIVINAFLGAGLSLDAFNTAFRFPNSLRDLFADGALSSAFIRTLVDVKTKGLEAELELVSIVTGFFLCITLCLASLATYFAPHLIHWMSNSSFQQRGGESLTIHLFQVLIFYLPLTMLNALSMARLGVEGQTFRAMNGAIFLSVGMVSGVLWGHYFSPLSGVWGLTWGAMAGALLQLIYQSWPFLKEKRQPLPCLKPWCWWAYRPLGDILILMLPRIIGQGASTLALMVNTFFALSIGPGAMTYVATTMIIIQVPIGLFGVATGFAALPVLTETLKKGHLLEFSKLLVESLDLSAWLALFTSLALSLTFLPFYMVLFQHGAIHFEDSLANCLTIAAFSTGIFFGVGSKVLINTLYAINATRVIVLNSLLYLGVSALLSYLWVPHLGLLGLGLAFGSATGLNFWLNYGFIYLLFYKQYKVSPYQFAQGWATYRYLLYTFLVFGAALLGDGLLKGYWPEWLGTKNRLYILGVAGLLCLVWGIFFLSLTRLAGPRLLKNKLMKREN